MAESKLPAGMRSSRKSGVSRTPDACFESVDISEPRYFCEEDLEPHFGMGRGAGETLHCRTVFFQYPLRSATFATLFRGISTTGRCRVEWGRKPRCAPGVMGVPLVSRIVDAGIVSINQANTLARHAASFRLTETRSPGGAFATFLQVSQQSVNTVSSRLIRMR
jgi:hypothetical protein